MTQLFFPIRLVVLYYCGSSDLKQLYRDVILEVSESVERRAFAIHENSQKCSFFIYILLLRNLLLGSIFSWFTHRLNSTSS